jgi:hypothetical protein
MDLTLKMATDGPKVNKPETYLAFPLHHVTGSLVTYAAAIFASVYRLETNAALRFHFLPLGFLRGRAACQRQPKTDQLAAIEN